MAQTMHRASKCLMWVSQWARTARRLSKKQATLSCLTTTTLPSWLHGNLNKKLRCKVALIFEFSYQQLLGTKHLGRYPQVLSFPADSECRGCACESHWIDCIAWIAIVIFTDALGESNHGYICEFSISYWSPQGRTAVETTLWKKRWSHHWIHETIDCLLVHLLTDCHARSAVLHWRVLRYPNVQASRSRWIQQWSSYAYDNDILDVRVATNIQRVQLQRSQKRHP